MPLTARAAAATPVRGVAAEQQLHLELVLVAALLDRHVAARVAAERDGRAAVLVVLLVVTLVNGLEK